jgi:transcriptional regulator NrdR family protein
MARNKNKKPDTRVCVPAPMPIQCPKCRSSKTTAANGVHYNLHFATRYEHRICSACQFAFTAMRRMTEEELAKKAPRKSK